MSNQRPPTEENFDTNQFNYLKYLPSNQNPSSYQNPLPTQDQNMNGQFGGRYAPPDSYRNNPTLNPTQGFDQKQLPQPQTMNMQYQPQPQYQQQRAPLDNLQNNFNTYQQPTQQLNQQDLISQFMKQPDLFTNPTAQQQQVQNQNFGGFNPQMLMDFLMKQQNQNAPAATPQQMLGPGFIGAAQLLAQTPSMSQQTSQASFDPRSLQMKPTDMAQFSEINKLHQNINSYQAQIDQIEKKNQPQYPQYNTVQTTPSTRAAPTMQNQSYLNQQFASMQQNVQPPSQHLQYQKQASAPLMENPQNQYPYKNAFEPELKPSQTFNYEPKPYNPNAYSEKTFSQERSASNKSPIIDEPQRNFNDYLPDYNKKKASPPKYKADPYSPQQQNYRYADDLVNDSMNFNNLRESSQNSPIRNKESHQFLDLPNSYNQEPSYRQSHHNMSQHSNQILQEQNNMLNTSHRQSTNPYTKNHSPQSHHYGEEENYVNQSMMSRQSHQRKHANVDDIPIKPAKTFEELLEMELAHQPNNNYVQESNAEKKEFLKRKKTNVAGGQTKKYNYYADNFEKKAESEPIAQPSKPEPKKKPEPKQSKPIEKPVQLPKFEQQPPELQKQESESQSKPKKPFLARGQGTAGGRKGFESSKNKPSSDDLKEKVDPKPSMTRTAQQSSQSNLHDRQDNKSPRPTNSFAKAVTKQSQQKPQVPDAKHSEQFRNSMLEFEQLEQQCIDKYSPNTLMTKKDHNQNKKKKKLFDSDSDEDPYDHVQSDQEPQPDHDFEIINEQQEQPEDAQPDEMPKSSLVRKYFHKEDPQAKKQTKAGPDLNVMSEQMQQVMNQKMTQLDKAMEHYAQENEKVQKLKREYEQLVAKQRVNQRELDTKKKKDIEEIEKLKTDELEKLKKEKKVLEQRQKNLQLVNSSNKKEREEIDFLKKELQRVSEEAKAKEQKQKATIDRQKAQIEDLQNRNKELVEEVKHLESIRTQTQVKQNGKKEEQKQSQSQLQQPRYTFNKEQEKQQEIKGILKNTKSSEKYKQESPQEQQDVDQEQDHYIDESEEEKETYSSKQSDQRSPHFNNQVQNQQVQQNQKQQVQQQQVQQNQRQQQKVVEEPPAQSNEEDEEEEDYDMKFPKEYHNRTAANTRVVEQNIGQDGKIQRIYENCKKEVIFNNGVKRETFPDGYTIVYFNNNDVKQTYPDQKVVYYFADAKTTQSTFPDGLQVFKFANGQIEKHFPDGTKEIIFPDCTIKCIFADGEEESIFPDGTIQRIEKNGIKAIEFSNGQKDILFPDGTRIREYPDGKIKKTFPDGTSETSLRQQ